MNNEQGLALRRDSDQSLKYTAFAGNVKKYIAKSDFTAGTFNIRKNKTYALSHLK
jgi:hypothetical protein